MNYEWVQENLNLLMTLGIVGIPTLIEVSPIKVNPWSRIMRTIGNALNKEVTDEIKSLRAEHKELKNDLTKHIVISDERDIKQCRLRILRFNDELLQGVAHTKEHFDNILEDIDEYEIYCDEHPRYENNKAVLAIENCKKTYLKCVEDKSFL